MAQALEVVLHVRDYGYMNYEQARERIREDLRAHGYTHIPVSVLDVRPELSDDDVCWLNEHAQLAGLAVEYAKEFPPPPPPPDYAD